VPIFDNRNIVYIYDVLNSVQHNFQSILRKFRFGLGEYGFKELLFLLVGSQFGFESVRL
jgi:hypothetical protein